MYILKNNKLVKVLPKEDNSIITAVGKKSDLDITYNELKKSLSKADLKISNNLVLTLTKKENHLYYWKITACPFNDNRSLGSIFRRIDNMSGIYLSKGEALLKILEDDMKIYINGVLFEKENLINIL